jgi:hypothetical protein
MFTRGTLSGLEPPVRMACCRTHGTWRSWPFLTITLALAVASAPANAQSVRGQVIDKATSRPLDNAIITLLTSRGADLDKPPVRSDLQGRFTIHAGDMGTYKVRATRIGYAPLVSPEIRLAVGGQVANLTLNMDPDTTKLSTVAVIGTARLNTYELMSHVGFELRMSKGTGKFLDTAELSRYKRTAIAHVLGDAKLAYGLDVVRGPFGLDQIVMTSGLMVCDPEFWIDGFQAGSARLEAIGADELYGVEVYNSATMPSASIGAWIGSVSPTSSRRPNPNYGRRLTSGRTSTRPCGAIVVWTKRFAKEMTDKANAVKPPLKNPKN